MGLPGDSHPVRLPAGHPARWLLAAAAQAIGGPAWLVGGAARDLVREKDRAWPDLDLAVPLGSLSAARRLADAVGGAFVPLGPEHGVARVVLRGSRAGPGVVDLADFRGPTLDADLAGRDVTVDALAVDLGRLLDGSAVVHDPLGGLADLWARRLRACHLAAFTDDPVRPLRLLRLAHELGFEVEPATLGLARAAISELGRVSAERVRDELTRLLGLPQVGPAVREADAWGLGAALWPEIGPMRVATQSAPHRFTVWEHSLRAVEAADELLADLDLLGPHAARVASHLAEPLGSALTRREVLRLAVLFHDVAKPETRTEEPAGRTRFIGHDRLGAERVGAIAARLRWPARAATILARLVRHHLRPMHLGMLDAVSPRARYRFFRDIGPEVPDLVCLTIADAAATDGRPVATVYRGRTGALLAGFLAGQEAAARTERAAPLLTGDDVMARRGLPPGPAVGRLLARAREAQALGILDSREAALRWLAEATLEGPDNVSAEAGGPGEAD